MQQCICFSIYLCTKCFVSGKTHWCQHKKKHEKFDRSSSSVIFKNTGRLSIWFLILYKKDNQKLEYVETKRWFIIFPLLTVIFIFGVFNLLFCREKTWHTKFCPENWHCFWFCYGSQSIISSLVFQMAHAVCQIYLPLWFVRWRNVFIKLYGEPSDESYQTWMKWYRCACGEFHARKNVFKRALQNSIS